ncbi:hypothetical protein FRC12_015995 [Ceratobasidium sp. 428]|nr:hypothetical protein FRC12_015995 [Ceratobasidium sp. 428]
MASPVHIVKLQAALVLQGLNDITQSVDLEQELEQFGGTANIYRGTYRQQGGHIIEVAVKWIRPCELDGRREGEHNEKTRKNLARELNIWHTISGGTNIIELLGIVTNMGPLPSAVSPLCTWNLQDMTDTLQGLNYMHEFKPSPITHGDIKSHNILVTADERAVICDFGRSRLPCDLPREDSKSSPFGATLRYMSPELFVRTVVGPTPASDMWSYGCVALEPYQEVETDLEVVEQIKRGRAPCERPRGIRGALLSDSLWATLASCWLDQKWRPTSSMFLEALTQMVQKGEVATSPIAMNLFPTIMDEPLTPWPEDMDDLTSKITIEKDSGSLASSFRSNIWMANMGSWWRVSSVKNIVVKVPRLNVHLSNKEPHDHLQNIFRRTVRLRYGIKHRNIINVLGIDTSFAPHPGLVLEYCENGSLTTFCQTYSQGWQYTTACVRPKSPGANAYSLIWDILEGLKYMHDYPIPVPQGDLTPDNILVGADGIAKISLFSFGRIVAAIPGAAKLTASVGPLVPFRWMSPELLLGKSNPTTESDMWSLGCVGFWLLTGLRPYAGHLRDDFAGVENIRGALPANITQIDYATEIGDRPQHVGREANWITNGLWSTITRCWTLDPSLRPSAQGFIRVLKTLEGRKHDWLPLDVVDLAGKIAVVDPGQNRSGPGRTRMARYITSWMYHRPGIEIEYREVDMILLKCVGLHSLDSPSTKPRTTCIRTTYTPNWFSKPVQVAVKQRFQFESQNKMHHSNKRHIPPDHIMPSIRHEVAITAQLDHPNIYKLLGIDTSHAEIPAMVFEYVSETDLEKLNDMTSAIAYLHEHPNGMIVYGSLHPSSIYITDDGRAKLTNFTSAFQYATQPTQIPAPMSSIASAKRGVSFWNSPEYCREKTDEYIPLPTASSDVWALGCMLLLIFVQKHPIFRTHWKTTIEQILEGIYPSEAPECADLDDRLLSLVRDIFKEDPAARPLSRSVLEVVSGIA